MQEQSLWCLIESSLDFQNCKYFKYFLTFMEDSARAFENEFRKTKIQSYDGMKNYEMCGSF